MPNYSSLIDALILSINQRVTTKNTTDSIDPVDVGGSITDVLSTILPILNTINEFNILGGNIPPVNSQGIDGDIYIQDGSTFAFYKKSAGAWVLKKAINLGINIVDGNINLQSSISGQVVTVSAGQWGINNVIYTKATQDQFTLDSADANFDRIDAVFANTSSVVHYVAGTASSNPDGTKPATPANEIIVCYIYVPSAASSNPPYISDSQTSVTPPSAPIIDKFISITVSGSLIGAYELDISAETDIPQPTTKPFVTIKPFGSSNSDEAQSAYTYNQSTKTIVGLPQLNEGDLITVYMVGRANTTPTIIPNAVIVGMDFGSAENFQAYLLSKGNTGAVVTNYQFPYGEGGEGFTVSGISSLVANTFAASDISVFIAGDWLTGNVGSNCFSGCANLTSFFAPNLSVIGLYCFDNCSALIELTIGNVQTINPGAFRNASGLSGETISLPTLLSPNGLGSSPADQGIFEGITGLTINNVPIAFQTNNSGTPDGDLQYVTTNGGTVTYV